MVQIMNVSILKNSIYIVSEYINGCNSDKVLFGEDEESTKLTIRGNDKMNVAQQILIQIFRLSSITICLSNFH